MSNPFEDPHSDYLVLINGEGQHSLWPAATRVPDGWQVAHGPAGRATCTAWVDEQWTDMRPRSLVGRRECPVKFPFSEYERLDMHPKYAELCAEERMIRISVPHGDDAWLACSYGAVKAMINDPRFSRALAAEHDEARLTPFAIRTSILGMDPPDHTRLRKLLAQVFTAQRVEGMRPWIAELANRLIDEMIGAGQPAELIEAFVLPLSGLVISELLGIPAADRPQFRYWIDGFASTTAMPEAEVEVRMNAMYAYITGLVNMRRESPGDDLISALISARDHEEQLTETELIEFVTVLLIAGYDTVALELMCSVYVLLTHPEQTALLRERPELMPQAVQELVRYIPLDSHVTFARYATEDVQVGDTLVRAGDAVLASFPSANHDAAVFERPEEFDVLRPRRANFGFGGGIHRCAGVVLALVEMQIALGTLLERLPHLRLAVPVEDVKFRPGMLLRSLETLPVAW